MRTIAQGERQAEMTADDTRGQAELGRVYAYLLTRRARRLAGDTAAMTGASEEEDALAPVAVATTED